MTSPDDTPTTPGWASPTGGPSWQPADSPAPAPVLPPPIAPPTSPPPPPPAAYGYGSSPGYGQQPVYRAPAAQPGIIPLRPLGLGEILDGAFRAIRANPRVMFGLTAVVVAITVALETVFQWYVGGLISGSLGDLTTTLDPTGKLGVADQLGPAAAQILAVPATSVATTVLTGLLIVSVSRSVLGQSVTLAEVWHGYRGRVALVVAFTIGLALAELIVFAALVGVVVLAATHNAQALAVVVGVLGALALFVGGIWLGIRTLLISPAIMLEGAGLGSAIKRGWRLTRGSFWRLLGIYLLTSIMVSIVVALIQSPATLIVGLAIHDPTSFVSLALLGVANIIGLTLTTVFLSGVVALLYIDVRMRREGLDVELARAAGESAA